MGIIEEFMERYNRELDYYRKAAEICAQQCEDGLESLGIRAIVTNRAKRSDKLLDKIRKRNKEKSYQSAVDIYDDIVDLAGVRIALYFPGDRDTVRRFILNTFNLASDPKEFPGKSKSSYKKRFSGYWATHFRVRLRPDSLNDDGKRYADTKIEIQVASVLMHAWSEVDHDLVYKPQSGQLSEDEYAILDELNGLVMSGEIALERLQRAIETRVKGDKREFANHYELASHLYESLRSQKVKIDDQMMGDINVLFTLLEEAKLNSVSKLAPYVKNVSIDTEDRPIVQQIIDEIILADKALYDKYELIRNEIEFRTRYRKERVYSSPQKKQAFGEFMLEWIAFEHAMREINYVKNPRKRPKGIFNIRDVKSLGTFDAKELDEINRLRNIRNQLVHGIEIPDAEYLNQQAKSISDVVDRLRSHKDPQIKRTMEGI